VQAIRYRLECAYQQRPHHEKSGGGFCASGKWKSIEGPEQSDTTETKRPTGEVNHRQAMLEQNVHNVRSNGTANREALASAGLAMRNAHGNHCSNHA
jgi:hypothetical protein